MTLRAILAACGILATTVWHGILFAQTIDLSLSSPSPACEYRATFSPPGSDAATLTIVNSGTSELVGAISVTLPSADWVQMAGGAFSVPAGESLQIPIVMEASASSVTGEDIYTAGIAVDHNDGTQTTPLVLPVEFFVFNQSGWVEFTDLDTITPNPVAWPYRVLAGTEDSCCGCVVTMLQGDDRFEIVPGPDPCEGEIRFAGGDQCCGYAAQFRATDSCGSFVDDGWVWVSPAVICDCFCTTELTDHNHDYFVDATDLAVEIQIVFFGAPSEMECFVSRADFEPNCVVDAVDLALMIDYVFFGGYGPGDCWWTDCGWCD